MNGGAAGLGVDGSFRRMPFESLPGFTATPKTALMSVFSKMRRQVGIITAYWRKVKSSPAYVLIVLLGALAWAYAMAWLVLPHAVR